MGVSRVLLPLLVGLALVVLAGLAFLGGDQRVDPLEGRVTVAEEAESVDSSLPELGRFQPARDRVGEVPGEPSAREEVEPASPTELAPGRANLVVVVRDGNGRALEGLLVEVHGSLSQAGSLGSELYLSPTVGIWGFEPRRSSAEAAGVTDWDGSLLLEVGPDLAGKYLVVGRGALTRLVARVVDPEVDEQLVVLDLDRTDTGGIEVVLTEPSGDPLMIEEVYARLSRPIADMDPAAAGAAGSPAPPPSWRVPRSSLTSKLGSKRMIGGLAPGVWSLGIVAVGGGVKRVDVAVSPNRWTKVEAELPLREFRGTGEARLDSRRPTLEPDELNGFAAYTIEGQEARELGQGGTNRSLRHTLRFAAAPKAALLELELEAIGHGARNDGISLEFLGADAEPRWGWGSRIADLPGTPGSWNIGSYAWVQLDLSELPGADGETVDLLPRLADGKLDLLVQDDTIVHSARLRTR